MIKSRLQKKIDNRIRFGFISGLFVVAAMGIFSYLSTVKSLQLGQSVVHTNEVLISLTNILSNIQGAETGQRGYIITKDPNYLDPFVMAVETINSQIIDFKNLTNESKKYEIKINILEKNIKNKLNELRQTIELHAKGEEKKALNIIKGGLGKKYMDNIRKIIVELEYEENRTLEKRANESNKSAFLTKIVLFLGSVFAFLVTILSFLSINRTLNANYIAQRKLDIYTKKLESSNNNMQRFTVVISHDLQEPLRKIQTFSDKIMSNQKDVLSLEGLESLNKIQKSAGLMRALFDSILFYFSVTNKITIFTPISLKEVIEKVILDFNMKIKMIDALIKVEDFPIIEADFSQMYQLFKQIIGNSLKFRKNDEKIVVKIYGNVLESEKEMFYEIFIQDNGIGFEERYLEKLFVVFQRLHSSSEFEGNGMGLAVCKKIIEAHNGFITAKSTIGNGSLFIITLPIKQAKIDNFTGEMI